MAIKRKYVVVREPSLMMCEMQKDGKGRPYAQWMVWPGDDKRGYQYCFDTVEEAKSLKAYMGGGVWRVAVVAWEENPDD